MGSPAEPAPHYGSPPGQTFRPSPLSASLLGFPEAGRGRGGGGGGWAETAHHKVTTCSVPGSSGFSGSSALRPLKKRKEKKNTHPTNQNPRISVSCVFWAERRTFIELLVPCFIPHVGSFCAANGKLETHSLWDEKKSNRLQLHCA